MATMHCSTDDQFSCSNAIPAADSDTETGRWTDKNTTGCLKNNPFDFWSLLWQMKTNFQNSFTGVFISKFSM